MCLDNLSTFSSSEGITNDMVTNVPSEQQFNASSKQLAKGSQRNGQSNVISGMICLFINRVSFTNSQMFWFSS